VKFSVWTGCSSEFFFLDKIFKLYYFNKRSFYNGVFRMSVISLCGVTSQNLYITCMYTHIMTHRHRLRHRYTHRHRHTHRRRHRDRYILRHRQCWYECDVTVRCDSAEWIYYMYLYTYCHPQTQTQTQTHRHKYTHGHKYRCRHQQCSYECDVTHRCDSAD